MCGSLYIYVYIYIYIYIEKMVDLKNPTGSEKIYGKISLTSLNALTT